MITTGILRDAWEDAISRARAFDRMGMVGYGIVELFDGDMQHKQISTFANLITDAGDLYYAGKAIASISPASSSPPTAVNGMKLGVLTATVLKATTGNASLAASADYISGSGVVFDTTGGPYPITANLGSGLGVNAVYKTTWLAGTVINSTINSVVIVNDQATNATTTTANTISRAVISTVNKTSSDTLAITWNHKFLGA